MTRLAMAAIALATGCTSQSEPTDPDVLDSPYIGRWPVGDCRAEVVPTGHAPGEIAEDFALLDQFGDHVHLHDFCNREVVLISAAFWCDLCRATAPSLEGLYRRYRDQGLMLVVLLTQDRGSNPPDQYDLEQWAGSYNASYPVLADVEFGVTQRLFGERQIQLPAWHQIGVGAEVLRPGYVTITDEQIEAALP